MKPTIRFVVLLALGLFPAALAARGRGWVLGAAAWDAALVLLLISERVAGIRSNWLEVERGLPDKLCLGEDNVCTVTVRSFAWLPLHVRIVEGWPAEFELKPGVVRDSARLCRLIDDAYSDIKARLASDK